MQILFPTLIVCCFKNDDNMLILTQEVSTKLLETFIEETIVKSQMEQIEGKSAIKSIGTLHPTWVSASILMYLVSLFPCSHWEVVFADEIR